MDVAASGDVVGTGRGTGSGSRDLGRAPTSQREEASSHEYEVWLTVISMEQERPGTVTAVAAG